MRTIAFCFLIGIGAMWFSAGLSARAAAEKHFEGPFRIKIADSKKVRATVTAVYRYPRMLAEEWWVASAVPPVFDGQPAARAQFQIVEAPFAERGRVADETSLRQPLATLHWFPSSGEDGQSFTVKGTYDVTINRRTLEPGKPKSPVAPLKHATERLAFLATSKHFDFTSSKFRSWVAKQDQKRKKDERNLDFAYRAMAALVKTHSYRYEPKSDRSASAVCKAGWSDCGGLSTAFVSILRANGIPARCLTGRNVKPDGTHVRLDFYAEGIGWVPGDPALAIARRSADAGFGREPTDMVIMHFDVIRFKHQYHWMQGIAVVRSINHHDVGSAAGMSLNHTMTIEPQPGDAGPTLAGPGRPGRTSRTSARPVAASSDP